MSARIDYRWLALIFPIAIFTLLRLPAILHQPGGQDEQFFAVPGYTVWREGIPRIPYFPAKERSTYFENADRCLMALPPALFYCQAPGFAFFPAGYPTARLPLFVAALIGIVLIFSIAKSFGANSWWALVAATLFAISRPLMFTGTIARPDLLCVVCGLTAIAVWQKTHAEPSYTRWLAIGGICGLACLFHPFGLVFLIQSILAAVLPPAPAKSRTLRLILLAFSFSLVLSLWLPLILRFPEEFRSQFFSNVLDRAGPGLPSRLVWPFPSLIHHSRLLWEFAGPWQCLLFAICAIGGTFVLLRPNRSDPPWKLLGLVWSGIYLTATVAGLHPTKGYWVYPAAMVLVLGAVSATHYFQSQFAARLTIVTLILLMLPGAGLRTAWIYLRHWGEPSYHAPTFIRNVLKDYPKEGLYLSDLSYVFDLYVSGRETLLLKDRADYAEQVNLACDYIFATWEGNDAGWADQYGPYSVKTEGQRSPAQACYVDVLVPAKQP